MKEFVYRLGFFPDGHFLSAYDMSKSSFAIQHPQSDPPTCMCILSITSLSIVAEATAKGSGMSMRRYMTHLPRSYWCPRAADRRSATFRCTSKRRRSFVTADSDHAKSMQLFHYSDGLRRGLWRVFLQLISGHSTRTCYTPIFCLRHSPSSRRLRDLKLNCLPRDRV